MDTKTLEALLLDRALGALSPEVEALLDAYLEHDAVAGQRATEFSDAAIAARRALASNAAADLPAFPRQQIEALRKTRRQLAWVRNAGGLAAVIVLGITIGVALQDAMSTSERTTVQGELVVVTSRDAATSAASSSIWSSRRIFERLQQPKADARNVIWKSAVERPQLGGA